MAGRAETVGERLKRLRLERGLSQRELASPGVSYAYISRIEGGTRQPSVKALRKLARRLEVAVAYLETGRSIDEAEERELRLADAELALRLGDRAEAEAQLQALAEEAASTGDRAVASRATLALALAADERGDHAAAIERFEQAFVFERPSALERVDVFATLGRAYGALGRTSEEIALYDVCLAEVAGVVESAATQTRYRILLSYALSDAGDLSGAEQALRVALREASVDEDPYMRVRVHWSLARLAEMEGRSAAALRHARRAIALLDETEDTLHQARARLLAAWIMNSAGNAAGAGAQLELADQLFGDAASADDRARLDVERARMEALRGNGAATTRLSRAVIELLRDQHDPILGTAYCTLGHGLALEGETDASNAAFARGVELLSDSRRWRDACEACRSWARLLREASRNEQALDVLERASQFALKLEHPVQANT